MSTQTFEASSVDKALEEAASATGIAVGDLQHTVEEKASDFWGLGETIYVVTVTVPEAEPAREEPAEAEPEAPSVAPEPDDAAITEPEEDPAPAQEEPSAEQTPSFFSYSESAPVAVDEAAATADEATGEADATDGAEEAEEVEDVATAEVASDEPAAARDTSDPQDESMPADGADLTKEAAGILDSIFAAMGFECTAEAKLDGDTMQVAITGEDNQYLLEGRGRGLAALELILNHSFRAWPNRAHKRVRVDAGDFRSQRDDEIRDMAYQVAHRAKETGSEQQTSELNPYERRIVHLTLADDHQVTTRSLGNGFHKAVNVIPTSGGQRRDQ